MKRASFLGMVVLLGACILLLAVSTVCLRRAADYSHLVAVSWGDGAVPAQYGAYVFYEPRATQLMVRATVHVDRPRWWSTYEHATVDLGLVRDETSAVRQWGQITWLPEGVQFGQGPQAVLIPRNELDAHAEPSIPWGWWGVCGVLALAMCAMPLAPSLWQTALDWQPGLAATQPWRWWTPAAVHYSRLHGAVNLAGLLLVAALGWAARLPRPAALAWALAWPLTHLGLALRPELTHYGGASGVLHAGVAVASLWLAWCGTARQRWVGIALGIGLAAKVLGEAPWGPVLQQREGWDIAIAPWAHTTGTLAGWLCALPCAALRPWRRSTGTACAPRP